MQKVEVTREQWDLAVSEIKDLKKRISILEEQQEMILALLSEMFGDELPDELRDLL